MQFRHPGFLICTMLFAATLARGETPVAASAPQGVTLSVYDAGLGLVSEARRAVLNAGDNTIVIRDLPARIDPASLSLGAAARALPFELLEQSVQYDLTSADAVLRRLTGQTISFDAAGKSREGILLAGPLAGEGTVALPVRSSDGNALWMVPVDALASVTFPAAGPVLAVEPQAVWRVRARQGGPQNFRLAYRTDGIAWRAFYELYIAHDALQADLQARVEIVNDSGGRFDNARIRIMTTEQGLAGPLLPAPGGPAVSRPAQRYAYGATRPAFERTVASLAPLQTYELPRTVTLEPDRTTYVQFLQSAAMPIKRFYVYDGVRFDRFQRNPRTDWSYGTEFHTTVQLHVEFENAEKFGLGLAMPNGLCRIFQVRADGSLDLTGEEQLLPINPGESGSVRVGPAIGLRGERERTGFQEVRPNQVVEETFQIRLANTSDDPAEIRVVEHLYRSPDFEIIRADAEYARTGTQTIEFRTELRAAARRAINYTVRYTW